VTTYSTGFEGCHCAAMVHPARVAAQAHVMRFCVRKILPEIRSRLAAGGHSSPKVGMGVPFKTRARHTRRLA
jgi:hypothetical protein